MKKIEITITGQYDENEYNQKDIADCIEAILIKWASHTSWHTRSISVGNPISIE